MTIEEKAKAVADWNIERAWQEMERIKAGPSEPAMLILQFVILAAVVLGVAVLANLFFSNRSVK